MHGDDFERFHLDRSCLLSCERAYLPSGKAGITLLLGRARHSLVTPFPTERLASGSTRMVVVKLPPLYVTDLQDRLPGRTRRLYPGGMPIH